MIDGQSWRDTKAPDSLRERVLSGRPAARPSPFGSPWLWRAAVVAGCASLVGLATLLPQKSSAASSLGRLVAAKTRSAIMFHLISYWVDATGKTPKIWSGYVHGERWHYVQSNFEQAFDGVRTITYYRTEGYATTELGQEHGNGQFLKTGDLSQWKIVDRKNLTLDHETLWRGRKVDKYTIKFKFTDEKGAQCEGTSTLLADAERNLPLYEEDVYSPTKGNALEWQYIEPTDEKLMRINLPPGTEVREVKPRAAAPLGVPEKASGGS